MAKRHRFQTNLKVTDDIMMQRSRDFGKKNFIPHMLLNYLFVKALS